MGVLQRFERRLEGLVEGVFARAFKSEVQPVEIGSALQRELDDKAAIVSPGRTLVPNDFAVELGDHDYERLEPYATPLQDELAAMVREHAADQRYSFVGPVTVTLQHVPGLETGVFHVVSDVVAGRQDLIAAVGETRTAFRLVVHASDRAGSYAVDLSQPVTIIGRGEDADLQLNDPGVSRRHAAVRVEHDTAVLTDLRSTNGTTVNGTTVDSATLTDGDQVRMGATTLVFHAGLTQGGV